ncbi:MAG: family 43 glycosylhydrolase, partial [Flavobacteriaceae bacterium]|nr:family 43 glycosylhydrolase [Flavobacteriaceae bacterium]
MINVNLIFRLMLVGMIFVNCGDSEPENPEPPDPIVKKYTNPVFHPVFADPTILDNRSRDGYFYAYATQDNWGTSAATERITPILRSTDLISWEDMGDAFLQAPNWRSGNSLVWAPDIEY